jgi:hypothetical protein
MIVMRAATRRVYSVIIASIKEIINGTLEGARGVPQSGSKRDSEDRLNPIVQPE